MAETLIDCMVTGSTVSAAVGDTIPAGVKTITIQKLPAADSDTYLFDNIYPEMFLVQNAGVAGANAYDTTVAGSNVDPAITHVAFVASGDGDPTKVDVLITHDEFELTSANQEKRIDIDWDSHVGPNGDEEIDCSNFYGTIVNATNPTTAGGNDGIINATGSWGGDYQYIVYVYNSDGVEVDPFALTAGNYEILVWSVETGCSDTIYQELVDPDAVPKSFCVSIQHPTFGTNEEYSYEFILPDNESFTQATVEESIDAITGEVVLQNIRVAGVIDTANPDFVGPTGPIFEVARIHYEGYNGYGFFDPLIASTIGYDEDVNTEGLDYSDNWQYGIDNIVFDQDTQIWTSFDVVILYTASDEGELAIDPYGLSTNSEVVDGMCELYHQLSLRIDGTTNVENPMNPRNLELSIDRLIDRTNALPSLNQNKKPYWVEDNALSVKGDTGVLVRSKLLLDDDGFLKDVNQKHFIPNQIRKRASTRLFDVVGTPGSQYKLHLKANRSNSGEGDILTYNHDYTNPKFSQISVEQPLFTIPANGIKTHVIEFPGYTASMSSTYSDRTIKMYIEPYQFAKTADGVPVKDEPYVLLQGLDTTKVNFGISCTGFTTRGSIVSVTGPAYFTPTARPEAWEGKPRSPYYATFSGTISRSGSKSISAISSNLNNYTLTNAAASDNKGTNVTIQDLSVTTSDNQNLTVSVGFYVNSFGDPDVELTPITLDLTNLVTTS